MSQIKAECSEASNTKNLFSEAAAEEETPILVRKITTSESAKIKSVIQSDTDYGYSRVLESLWVGGWRWWDSKNTWMRWNERVWEEATEEEAIRSATEDLLKEIGDRLSLLGNKNDTNLASIKYNKDVSTFSRVKSILKYLKGSQDFLTRSEEWDADHWILNLENGMLDLRDITCGNTSTLKLKKHSPETLCTRIAPVSFDPSATVKEWNTHLEFFIDDPEVRREIQRGLGISLVGANLVEMLHIWFGSGANGKSTTATVIQAVLGGYSAQAAPNLLVKRSREEHPTEIADLCGKRVVFSSETANESKLDEAKVKQLTGGDVQKARYMRQDYFEFKQTWKLFLLCNHKPSIVGTDHGIWRRVRLIPWTMRIPVNEQKPQEEVITKLLQEKAGILNWLIEGVADWYLDRSWFSEAVMDETQLYRSEQDVLSDFLERCCDHSRSDETSVADLYEAYQEWCSRENEEPLSKTTLGKRLAARGRIFSKKGTGGVRLWKGLLLKSNIHLQHNSISDL